MSSVSVTCVSPWLFLLLIPAAGVAFWTFFRRVKRKGAATVSLVLHLLMVLCCVCVLAGLEVTERTDSVRNEVILVVDVSDSTGGERVREQAGRLLEEAAESGGAYSVGVVTFARNQILVSPATPYLQDVLDRYAAAAAPDGTATNIADALLFAGAQLKNPRAGRLILLTDGRQTDGSALAAIGSIVKDGVRVDVVYITPEKPVYEMQITGVTLPERYFVGDTVKLSVTIESASAGNASLALYANDGLAGEQYLEIERAGALTAEVEYTINAIGLHKFHFVLTPELDTLSANNEYFTFIEIDAVSRVLILEGEAGEGAKLLALFEDGENYLFEVSGIADAPKSLTKLRTYNEVVLMNVQNADLPYGFAGILKTYVEEYGGGLLTVGGDRAYQGGDMSGSTLEELLPVLCSSDAKPVSVVMVIDASGSMGGFSSNGKTAIEMAKQGAKECIAALSGSDFVGVISFDGIEHLHTGTSLIPASQKQNLYDAVDEISAGGGTLYEGALQAARTLLLSAKTELRTILFLTDGMSQEDTAQYMHVVESLRKEGVTVTAFGICDYGASPDLTILENIAAVTGGEFYKVDNVDILPEIMVDVAYRAQSLWRIRAEIIPRIKSENAVVGNLENLPVLSGYYSVQLKSGAQKLLEGGDPTRGDAILAFWNYGKGRVCSFMSDLSGVFSERYFEEEPGKNFIENVVNFLFSSFAEPLYEVEIGLSRDNLKTALALSADNSGGETLKAVLEPPDGETREVRLSDAQAALLDTAAPGFYKLTAVKTDMRGKVLSERVVNFAVSYSLEYAAFADDAACYSFLRELCDLGGGTLFSEEQPKFGRETENFVNAFDVNLVLLLTAAACFLSDIAARRFKLVRRKGGSRS